MQKTLFTVLALVALSPKISQAGKMNPCFEMSREACEVFSLTNVERLRARLSPLTYAPSCYSMAQEQSEDMASRNYFDHRRPASAGKPAEDFAHRAARFGLERGVGENIAMAKDSAQAMKMWMNSPGHRRNILNPRFHRLGVGFDRGLYTQAFGD